jgi:hypothetical protein
LNRFYRINFDGLGGRGNVKEVEHEPAGEQKVQSENRQNQNGSKFRRLFGQIRPEGEGQDSARESKPDNNQDPLKRRKLKKQKKFISFT